MRNPERAVPSCRSFRIFRCGRGNEFRLGPWLAGDELPQFLLSHFPQTVEIGDLVLQRVISAVEPEPAIRLAERLPSAALVDFATVDCQLLA